MKTRTHLFLLPAVALLPLLMFSAAALTNLLDAERSAALRSVQEAARATSLAVDREWAHAEGLARALGTSDMLARHEFVAMFDQARRAIAGRDLNVALLDNQGLQVFNTALPFGAQIPATPAALVTEIRQVIAEGVPSVSDVVRGPATGRLVVVMRVPVQTSRGASYVVSPWFYAESLQRAFAGTSDSPEMLVGIFDRKGRTIAINRGSAKLLGELPRADLLQAILDGRSTVLRNESRGGEKRYTLLTRSALTGWTVAVGVPEHRIEAAARQAVWLTAAGLSLAFGLAVLAAFLYGQRLMGAMQGVSRSAGLLGQGIVPPPTRSGVDEMDQVQAALRDAGERLARTEVERSNLLAQSEAARSQAEQQNRAKDEFLAMLGHELRNPLSAIMSGLTVMEHPAAAADAQQRAQQIVRRQSERLTSIVDELLDAGRVLTGKVSLSRQPVNLADLARGCVEEVQMTGAADRHRLSVRTSTAWVDGDPTRLAQIATNLLDNALKYTPDGGRLELTVAAEGTDAVLAVRDTGVGMDAGLLASVFDVFVQGPATLDRSKGGLGIGLAVVRAMVEQHAGSVVAESPGHGLGSCFTVRLPLLPGASGTVVQGTDAPLPRGASGRQILLVDDNDDARAVLAQLLVLEGAHVLQARDGAGALHSAMKEQPPVAVIDIGLPDIDGYEVARRLRRDPRTRSMHLVALTGYGQEADRALARAAGFDRHLTKPVDLTELLAAL